MPRKTQGTDLNEWLNGLASMRPRPDAAENVLDQDGGCAAGRRLQ